MYTSIPTLVSRSTELGNESALIINSFGWLNNPGNTSCMFETWYHWKEMSFVLYRYFRKSHEIGLLSVKNIKRKILLSSYSIKALYISRQPCNFYFGFIRSLQSLFSPSIWIKWRKWCTLIVIKGCCGACRVTCRPPALAEVTPDSQVMHMTHWVRCFLVLFM